MSNGTPPPAFDDLGKVVPPDPRDPAAAPPRDPLADGKVTTRARVILRDIPLTGVTGPWSVPLVRSALYNDLPMGIFQNPALLWEAIVADDRVHAALSSRTGGLSSQPIRFSPSQVPGVDAGAAKECLEAWQLTWPKTMNEAVMRDLEDWSVGLGQEPAQIMWDTSEFPFCPYIRPFHQRFTFYHWIQRRHVAVTMDGMQAITPGDGHWLLHAPYGEHRGWMKGAIRAIAEPWLIRRFAIRDHAYWSERHGFPQVKAKTPAAADEQERTAWLVTLAGLGQISVIECTQGVDKEFGYDFDLVEATDGAWQGFTALIQQCEASIVLALLGQNLTTEVKEGSFAAARVHADVRQALLESDARALAHTVYTQIARPFAAINFGDGNLAPITTWDVRPLEDRQTAADVLLKFAQGLYQLRQAGKEIVDITQLARTLGIVLDSSNVKDVPPPATGGGGAGAPVGGEAK